MATVAQHMAQWKHNRQCANSVGSAFRDWQINVIFYAALHAVDAALTHLNAGVCNHELRNRAVKTNAAFASIRYKYLNLYRISKITRYDAEPDNWVPKEYLTTMSLADDLLRPIEIEIERIVGKNANLPDLKLQQ